MEWIQCFLSRTSRVLARAALLIGLILLAIFIGKITLAPATTNGYSFSNIALSTWNVVSFVGAFVICFLLCGLTIGIASGNLGRKCRRPTFWTIIVIWLFIYLNIAIRMLHNLSST